MRAVIPNYHRSRTFFFFVVLTMLHPVFSISVNTLSATESLTVSNKRTIVSLGNVFELGFFRTVTSSREGDLWYLGIWYKTIHERTYVWVANRDNPLSNSTGTLKISDSNLIIFDESDTIIWSTNLTGVPRSPVVAELLDNGNFVLRDSTTSDPDRFLWQSFDFPTDTLLPQMKLGWDLKTGLNKYLRSWKSPFDPSSGDYFFKLKTQEFPEFFLWNIDTRVYRSGPWDGIKFSGIPEMQEWNNVVNNFTENREEVAYSFQLTNHNIFSRLIMNPTGSLQRFMWIPKDQEWNIYWELSVDNCDTYMRCSNYSYCDMNTSPLCNCIEGFGPRKLQEGGLSGECVRKTQLSCARDEFLRLEKVKLPETMAAFVDRKIGLKECKDRCVRNCNCTAYANTDIRNDGWGCVMWTDELADIRNYTTAGQDLYVRVAAADLG